MITFFTSLNRHEKIADLLLKLTVKLELIANSSSLSINRSGLSAKVIYDLLILAIILPTYMQLTVLVNLNHIH